MNFLRSVKEFGTRKETIAAGTLAFFLVISILAHYGAASFGSTSSQAAATALGNAQGVPAGGVGSTYPDYTTCYINLTTGYAPQYTPLCRSQSFTTPVSQTFYSGILSADLGGGLGQSVYSQQTYTPSYVTSQTTSPSCVVTKSSTVCTCPSGYTFHNGVAKGTGPYCEKDTTHPAVLTAPAYTTVGPAVSTTPNATVTLEWSCLPSMNVWEEWHVTGDPTAPGGFEANSIWSVALASGSSGTGTGFSPSGLTGSRAVTLPNADSTYTYTLACGSNHFSIPVTTTGPLAPTLSITGNGQTGSTTVPVGTAVTVTATFTPSTGDSITRSAINDFSGTLWCGTGNTCSQTMWTQAPIGTKTYTFTPSAAGSYLFTPSTQTTQYGSWNNWGQSLTINAQAACQNGQGFQNNCTSCNDGYTLSGGQCVPQCPHGQGPVGSCTSCDTGFTLEGTAPNNECVAPPAGTITGPISANPSRIRSGESTSLTWSTTNMTSCSVKDDTGAVVSTALNSGGTPTGIITRQTGYTLSCTDGTSNYTSSVTVKLVPLVKEI